MHRITGLVLAVATLFSNGAHAQCRNSTLCSFSGSGARQGPHGIEKPRVYYNADVADFKSDEWGARLDYVPRWDTAERSWPGFTGYAYVLNGDIPVNVLFFARSGEIADWQQNRFQHLITHISDTPYFRPVKKYFNRGYNQGQTHYVNKIYHERRYYHPCDRDWQNRNGKNGCGTINDNDVTNIITTAVRQGHLTYQKDGIYLFVMGGSIQLTSNGQLFMGNHFCGYHGTFPIDNNWFKYATVRIHDSCAPLTGTPSGAATDAALYMSMHEMIETITSPNPAHSGIAAGWYDGTQSDNESMDKCDKAVSSVRNWGGGNFNVEVNGLQYLLPSVFDPVLQFCTLNGWFNLRTEANLGLTVDAWTGASQAYLWSRHDGNNQKFRFDGEMLRSGDNLCLTVRDWSNGPIVNANCNNQDNQKWIFDTATKRLRPRSNQNKCFDASCNNSGCGIHLWDCHTGSNQRWRFTNVHV